ncbi:hypothetical protein GFS60_06822 (plasmid) [Rhodococcus sp. WAY2]|nr:hypothetical protein GFS60_06822 [Rhodococcus sp. WAY2]
MVLRVAAAGVCQTDVHVRAAPEPMIPTGVVLGHEIAGHIVECGDGVDNLSIGDSLSCTPSGPAADAGNASPGAKTPV